MTGKDREITEIFVAQGATDGPCHPFGKHGSGRDRGRDWDGATTKIDVGFPVSPADAAKAGGEVLAGNTPAGQALKAVHRGAYARSRTTYATMEADLAAAGLKAEGTAWKVHMNDPAQTPEGDL